MADMADAVNITLDVDLPVVTEEVGTGRLVRLQDADWTTSNVRTTNFFRGYLLDSVQGAADWRTTVAGDYARQRLAAFTQTAGTWTEIEQNVAADYWCLLAGTTGTLTTTGTTWSSGADGKLRPNPHIHVSAFVYGGHDTAAEILRFTWGDAKWQLSVFGNGSCSLLRDEGSGLATVKTGTLFAKGSITQGPIRFRMVPLFRRCLYLWGMGGSETCYEDYSLDPAEGDWTDTGAATPLVAEGTLEVEAFQRCALQITEVKYLATGTAETTIELPYAPTESAQYVSLDGATPLEWKDEPDGTTVVVDSPSFTPDGETTALPLRATLTRSTDKLSTPVVCGLGVRFDPVLAQRAADETAIISDTLANSLSLDVGEERSTVAWTMRGSDYSTVQNRAMSLRLGTAEVFAGNSRGPTWTAGLDENTSFEAGDWWDRAERTQMPSDFDYAGSYIHLAIGQAFMALGLPLTRISVETGWAALPPRVQNDQDGEAMPLTPAIGTTIADWLRYLWSFTPEWFLGFEPVAGVMSGVYRDPATSTTPALGLCVTEADAWTFTSGATEYRQYEARDWVETRIEPECTRVTVIGQAPGGLALVSTYYDPWAEVAIRPTPTPANWVGEVWERVIQDTELTTQEAVVNRCRAEMDKASKAWAEATVTCGYHPNLRRQDVVRVYGSGGVSYTDWRVQSYRVLFDSDIEWDGQRWRTMEITLRRKLA